MMQSDDAWERDFDKKWPKLNIPADQGLPLDVVKDVKDFIKSELFKAEDRGRSLAVRYINEMCSTIDPNILMDAEKCCEYEYSHTAKIAEEDGKILSSDIFVCGVHGETKVIPEKSEEVIEVIDIEYPGDIPEEIPFK